MNYFQSGKAVVPNDAVDLPDGVAWALTATVAGTVSVDTENGETVSLALNAAFSPATVRIKRVRATGTTATGLTAWYGPIKI
jgi:hypothetical protein